MRAVEMEGSRRSAAPMEPGPKKPRLDDSSAAPNRDRNQFPPPAPAARGGGGSAYTPAPAAYDQNSNNNINNNNELVGQYKAALAELTFNSKPIITNLTIIAGENILSAKSIASTICSHIVQVPSEQKLPSLYLLDSIVKNIGRDYIKYFASRLAEVFCKAYKQVDGSVHASMRHLFGTWKGVFPPGPLLSIEKELGFQPAVPLANGNGNGNGNSSSASVAAAPKPDSQSQQQQRPSHSIHVNPKYLQARQRIQPPPSTTTTSSKAGSNEDMGLTTGSGNRADRSPVDRSSAGWTDLSSSRLNASQREHALREREEGRDVRGGPHESDMGVVRRQRVGASLDPSSSGASSLELEARINKRNASSNKNSNNRNNSKSSSVSMSMSWKNSEEEEYTWDDFNTGGGTSASSTPPQFDFHNKPKFTPSFDNHYLGIGKSSSLRDPRIPLPKDEVLCEGVRSQHPSSTSTAETGEWALHDEVAAPSGPPPAEMAGLRSRISASSSQPPLELITENSGKREQRYWRAGSAESDHLRPSINNNNNNIDSSSDSYLEAKPPPLSLFRPSGKDKGTTLQQQLPNTSTDSNTESRGQAGTGNTITTTTTADTNDPISKLRSLMGVLQQQQQQQPPLPSGPPPIPLSSVPTSRPVVSPTTSAPLPPLPPGPPPPVLDGSSTDNPLSSLLSSLVAKGLISNPSATKTQNPNNLEPAQSNSNSNSREGLLIGYEFRPETVREYHGSVITSLFEDLAHQCRSCGLRFRCKDQLDAHLEQRHTVKESSQMRSRNSRGWYASSCSWVAGVGLTDGDEDLSEGEETGDQPMVPADETQILCALCGQPFEDFYSVETEQWMYKSTVHLDLSSPPHVQAGVVGPIIVHANCASQF